MTPFITRAGYRRRGISYALARAAVDFVRERGGRTLEGYPMITKPGTSSGKRSTSASAASSTRQGSTVVSHPTPRRVVMRIDFSVVANETAPEETLIEELRARVHVGTEILVVCPALNSRLRHWTSDEDGARTAAEERLNESLERLALFGVEARGYVGDADPMQAIDDALRMFAADEIVLSTHPPERSHWLARNITERAQCLFGLPVTHLVIDTARERRPASSQAAVEGSAA